MGLQKVGRKNLALKNREIAQGAHVVVTTLHKRLFVTFERRHNVF
jgi:hypothetical protein